ncbi:hypothetical protein SPACI_010310 [Sporomusa acidovorans DSM 3132]|uniref:TonB-dependent receptor-like beta-barrel domain-containing protein n=1 Tax=Sporomusa acidovorans (strain ATCC 49682 / DSM 3132 / Mol) TaxID=1123286 RepID=A0ABZ3IYT9_SPOA4|nr:hypothetical protein SPACI_36460 [Sporomusa acidovorans DSM 3132]SDE10526.1 hypothetical protein SAMN04488499_100817 [Sporomusa acidovorans]
MRLLSESRKLLGCLVVFVGICLLLAGCRARPVTGKTPHSEDGYAITDDSGCTMMLAKNPKRIVSLAYSLDEILVELEHYNDPSTDTAAIRKNALRNSLAIYGAYTYAMTPDFSTTLGLRGHFIDDYATRQNVFLPQIQTLYKINDSTSWYTNIGKSFQMPALNQYFAKQDADLTENGFGFSFYRDMCAGLILINLGVGK